MYHFISYRFAKHESIRLTSANIIFGRQLRLPVDILVGRPEKRHHSPSNYHSCLEGDMVWFYNPEEINEDLQNWSNL